MMIPTIEKIVEDLIAGNITQHQAVEWLHEHAKKEDENLRDMFAGFACQGLCADRHHSDTQGSPENIAEISYYVADEMMKARKS
jgi:hypothetical protein